MDRYASLEKLGFDTGAEFVVAMERAATMSIPVLLADRDVDETLRALADAARATTPEEVTALNERLLAAGNTDQLFATNDRAGIASSVELIKQRDTVRGFVDSSFSADRVFFLLRKRQATLFSLFSLFSRSYSSLVIGSASVASLELAESRPLFVDRSLGCASRLPRSTQRSSTTATSS